LLVDGTWRKPNLGDAIYVQVIDTRRVRCQFSCSSVKDGFFPIDWLIQCGQPMLDLEFGNPYHPRGKTGQWTLFDLTVRYIGYYSPGEIPEGCVLQPISLEVSCRRAS
jgi:hypothetical protein